MEVLILWVIIGAILRMVGEAKKGKQKQQQMPPAQTRRVNPQTASAEPKKEKAGLLDSFINQLRELEEQERQRQQKLTPQGKGGGKKKTRSAVAAEEEEHAAQRFRREKDEMIRRRLEKTDSREVLPDAYYAKRKQTGFSLEDLERRFPNPEQRMIVFSEIMGKPKALQKR